MRNRMWTVFFLALVVFIAAVVGLFFSYRHSSDLEAANLRQQLAITEDQAQRLVLEGKIQQQEELGAQIWGFMGTNTFETVIKGILLAAILAALGGYFKIDQVIDQRIRNEKQKRIDNQTDSIKQTAKMWDDLYCIVSELRFYDDKAVKEFNANVKDAKDRKKTVEDILQQIENFASKAEEVVNTWHFVFPELAKIGKAFRRDLTKSTVGKQVTSEEDLEEDLKKDLKKGLKFISANVLILVFINVLYDVSSSVAYFIRKLRVKEKAEEDIKPLQDSLGVIQDVIKDLVHQSMLGILKYSVEPIDGWGAVKMDDDYARDQIKELLRDLFEKAKQIKEKEKSVRPLPKGDLVKNWEYKYSEDNIKELAKSLGEISVKGEKDTRTKWDAVIIMTNPQKIAAYKLHE